MRERGAEMAHGQRIARVMLPPCKLCSCMADARENTAEHAKANAILFTTATQSKKRNTLQIAKSAKEGKKDEG